MISLRTLGPVEVSLDGKAPPPELLWRKNLALLVYLARSPRRTRTRQHLMNLLWGDRPESSARHSLREAMRVLRQATGEGGLEADGDQVRLGDGVVVLDIERLDALASAADWKAGAELVAGEFLEGFGVSDAPAFEDWLSAERMGIKSRAVEALTQRSLELLRGGDLAAGANCARRALVLDPSSDGAARALVTALSLRGERAAALEAVDAFGQRLRDQLGAEPSQALQRLADQVRRERVFRSAPAADTGAVSRRAPLAGRESQLASLLDCWKDCRAGRATMVLIDGPSGAGRTRLMDEALNRARLDGAAATAMRATPADRNAPWAGALALAAGGLLSSGGVGAAPPEALAAFASVLEEWGDRYPSARALPPRPTGRALSDVVRAVAAEQPVVLAVDDAHWLDAESLTALHALARDLGSLPVLILLTAESHPPREEIALLHGRLGRDVPGTSVTLEALGPEALRTLARWAMPSYDTIEVDRLARRIAADSAGLPLLAVELLHAVALGMDLGNTEGAWPQPQRTLDQTLPSDLPHTVVAAIRIGFRRLSADTQNVLVAASLLGDLVETEPLARTAALSGEALAAALDEAEWQRWLVSDGRGYRFVARVARDVVARDMVTPGQRRRMLERA